ncbi:MAG: XdhC family protein [Filomicrobium sp.]
MTDSLPGSPLPDTDLWRCAAKWLTDGRTIALATVVDTWGSAPVPLGGQMVIATPDQFQGSVSGGCVEVDVITAALELIDSGQGQLLSFGVSNETAWQQGLPCGGTIEVFVERLSPAEGLEFANTMATARDNRVSILIETNLKTGQRRLYQPSDDMPPGHTELFAQGRSKRIKSECEELFLQILQPAPKILIVGATHIAQALVAHLNIVDASAVVIDPRDSFASQARFGETEIRNEWPAEAFETLDVDEHTAVVVLAHVAQIDDEALTWALKSKARFIGALGSRRNHKKRCERLKAAGFSDQDLARIRCPIGLNIGAVTPEEIALATAAEIVMTFRQPRPREET